MRPTKLAAALLAAALVVAPVADAIAKAGGGGSMGSRGSRSYSSPPSTNTAPTAAQPLQRSMTPQQAPGGMAAAGAGAAGGGMSRGGMFASGLMGGLIGAGIGGLLFGGGLTGGLGGFLSFIGLALQLALLFFVGRWLFRMFMRRRQPALAGMPNGMERSMQQPDRTRLMQGGGAASAAAVAVGQDDFKAFDQSLQAVQAAWTARDMSALQRLATPEMASYFSDQLSEHTSRGVRNEVTDVKLEQGDLAESWAENGREYATVAMRFSANDVTRDGAGRVTDGDLATRTMTTEVWTFVRVRGGQWLLSAIQQTR